MNRAASCLLSATLAVLTAIPVAAARAESVAVVAAVEGPVRVTPAGTRESVRVEFGRLLERGDRITAAAKGGATLFFNDGNVIELAGGSSITIGGRPRSPRPDAVAGEVFDRVRRYATAGSRRTGLVAMSGMRTGETGTAPLLLGPRNTALLTPTPRFSWRAVAGAAFYRVRLAGGNGEPGWVRDVGARALRPDPELAYPADAAPLADGTTYRWQVEALDSLGTLATDSTMVTTLSAAERDSVRASLAGIAEFAGGPEAPAARFLAGSYLATLGLHEDALAQFAALAAAAPDSPGAHEALGGAYLRLGLHERAAAEFRVAERLRGTGP